MLETYEDIERNFYLINKQIRNIEDSDISLIFDDLYRTKQLEEQVGLYSGIPYGYMRKFMSREQKIKFLKSLNLEKAINKTLRRITHLRKGY